MRILPWFKKILILIVLFFAIDFAISSVLLIGLNKYFGLNSNAKILINGSSMAVAGFDKVKVEHSLNKSVAFYTRTGVSLQDRNAMLNHYFNGTQSKVEIVVFEVNPMLFSKKFTAENVYMLFLPFIDDTSMDALVRSNTTLKEYCVRKLIRTSRYNSDLIALSIKGYLGNYENKKYQVLDANALLGLQKHQNSVTVELNKSKIELFETSLALVKQHAQKIILVNMPIFSTKMGTFKKAEYQNYMMYLNAFCQKNSGFYLLDLNQSDVINDPAFFADPLHLNAIGQLKVTEQLTDYIEHNNVLKN